MSAVNKVEAPETEGEAEAPVSRLPAGGGRLSSGVATGRKENTWSRVQPLLAGVGGGGGVFESEKGACTSAPA